MSLTKFCACLLVAICTLFLVALTTMWNPVYAQERECHGMQCPDYWYRDCPHDDEVPA